MNRVVIPVKRPGARQRLVCLTFCGGGTSAFRGWGRAAPENVEVVAVCYAGRERRFSEPAATTWDDLLADALAAVRDAADRPYVLFGHSLGAWVGFEVTARLERESGPLPQLLVVSSSNAPTAAQRERLRTPPAGASDESLLDWMRRAGQLSAEI